MSLPWPYYLPTNPCCNTDPCGNVIPSCGCTTGCTDPCHTYGSMSDNLAYTGASLPCTGIDMCDTLTVVIQKLEQAICTLLAYHTTTTTTTATPTTTTTTTVPPTTTTTTTIGLNFGYNPTPHDDAYGACMEEEPSGSLYYTNDDSYLHEEMYVYTDAACTTPFDGDSHWWYCVDFDNVAALINSEGYVIQIINCVGLTTTTTTII